MNTFGNELTFVFAKKKYYCCCGDTDTDFIENVVNSRSFYNLRFVFTYGKWLLQAYFFLKHQKNTAGFIQAKNKYTQTTISNKPNIKTTEPQLVAKLKNHYVCVLA